MDRYGSDLLLSLIRRSWLDRVVYERLVAVLGYLGAEKLAESLDERGMAKARQRVPWRQVHYDHVHVAGR